MKLIIVMFLLSMTAVSFANDKLPLGEKPQECADTPGTACHALKMKQLEQQGRQVGKQIESGDGKTTNQGNSSATKR